MQIKFGNKKKNFYCFDTLNLFISLFKNLSLKNRRKLIANFFLMILTAIAECFTVIAILPLISRLTGLGDLSNIPNLPFETEKLFSVEGNFSSMLFFFIFLVFLSGFLKILDLYKCADSSASATHDLSKKTFKKYLLRPYEFHAYANNSSAIATLTNCMRDTNDFIYNLLRLFSSILILIALIITLLKINLSVSIFSFLVLSFAYLLLGAYTKNKLIKLSGLQVESIKAETKLVQESLMTIREIKIWNAYELFYKNYAKADWNLRSTERSRLFLGPFPRFFIEGIGIMIFVLIAIFSNKFNLIGFNMVALLGTFAFGVQRLLPTINLLYNSWTYVNSYKKSAKSIIRLLNDSSLQLDSLLSKNQYEFKSSIEFKNVFFKYPKATKIILKKINIKFKKGDVIGVIGRSGEGKSTFIDLIAGMLVPNSGDILIDEKLLHNNNSDEFVTSWRTSFGYVSQKLFFIEGNFIDNIAFGVRPSEVDFNKVKEVAKIALIDKDIESYPKNFYDNVYENAKNLSGGQKQRLGIARALYRSQNLLILDEATSGLDKISETKILNNIFKFNKKITVFLVTHNPDLLRYCNKKIELFKGNLKSI